MRSQWSGREPYDPVGQRSRPARSACSAWSRLSDNLSVDVVALVRLYVGTSRTSCPFDCSARPRKFAPPPASMPINSTCRFA